VWGYGYWVRQRLGFRPFRVRYGVQMARARDKDEGLQNTETSFKLEPQQHEQETRKSPENWQDIMRRDSKDIGLS